MCRGRGRVQSPSPAHPTKRLTDEQTVPGTLVPSATSPARQPTLSRRPEDVPGTRQGPVPVPGTSNEETDRRTNRAGDVSGNLPMLNFDLRATLDPASRPLTVAVTASPAGQVDPVTVPVPTLPSIAELTAAADLPAPPRSSPAPCSRPPCGPPRRERGPRRRAGAAPARAPADPASAILPWELLYDTPRGSFLARDPLTPIVRYLEGAIPDAPPSPVRHVLAAGATPTDLPPLDVASELARVAQTLAPAGIAVAHVPHAPRRPACGDAGAGTAPGRAPGRPRRLRRTCRPRLLAVRGWPRPCGQRCGAICWPRRSPSRRSASWCWPAARGLRRRRALGRAGSGAGAGGCASRRRRAGRHQRTGGGSLHRRVLHGARPGNGRGCRHHVVRRAIALATAARSVLGSGSCRCSSNGGPPRICGLGKRRASRCRRPH